MRVEHLDHRRQTELLARLNNEFETIAQGFSRAGTDSLPAAIGTGTVLHHSPAQGLGASLFDDAGRLHDLRLALDRARASDYRELIAADLDVTDTDGVVNQVTENALLRRAFVGTRDGNQALNAAHLLDFARR